MSDAFVSVLMGSDSDLPIMQITLDTLDSLHIPWEAQITCAHRTPEATHDYVRQADKRGCGVFIATASLSAHLAGAVSAQTVRPVIGVPLDSESLSGQDSLLSTVQMPSGNPVASVAMGKTGARNAAYLAAQILGISNDAIATRLAEEREENARSVEAKNRALQEKLGKA